MMYKFVIQRSRDCASYSVVISLTTKLKYESDLWMYLWSGCKRRGPLHKPVGQASATSPYNSVFQPTSSKRTYLGNLRQPAYPSSQLSSSASPTSSAPATPRGPQLHPTHVASLHGILFYACAALTGGGDGKLTAAGGGGGGSRRLFLLPYPSQGLVHLMLHFGKRLLLHGLLARRQRAGQRLPRCLERLQPQLLASSASSPPTTAKNHQRNSPTAKQYAPKIESQRNSIFLAAGSQEISFLAVCSSRQVNSFSWLLATAKLILFHGS